MNKYKNDKNINIERENIKVNIEKLQFFFLITMLCGEKHFGQGSQIVFNFGVRQQSRQDTHIRARHVAHAFCKG